ncbi:MAG: hypothetical protein Q9190_000314 [Brigantiaea leucoxantha]
MPSHSLFRTICDVLNELLEPNDFKVSTWMAMGAVLLLLSQTYLPSSLGTYPPILYLGYRIAKMVIDTLRLHTGSYTTLVRGRWTATLAEPEVSPHFNSGSDGLVMFVLGARINQFVPLAASHPDDTFILDGLSLTSYSPFGKLSPGAAAIDEVFQDMWREAEENRIKWGCKTQLFSLASAYLPLSI